jgi:hypothetical protein
VPAAGASPISEYRVYRAAGADPEVSLATVMAPATSFDDAAVVAGVTYRYRVTAVNGDGEGPFSSEAAAALPMAPSAPALTGVPDDGAAHLCWTAPVDGGSAITGYRLYRAVVGDPLALRADLPTTPLQYEDGGVTNGVTYAYAVSATNAVGEGPASATVQVRPSATGTAPTITSVAPSIGSPGDAITIQGTNFASGACLEVTFDTRPATVTSANATTVVAPVPNAGGSGHITVATPSGQAASAGDFFAVPPPSTPALVEVAGRIVFGTPLTTSISTSGKIGLLLFDGSSGQRISLNISNSTISSSNISVLKPDGSTLATKRVAPNGFIDVQTLPATGTYVVLVDPETTKTGSLKLTLYDVPADATGTITAGGPSVTLTTTTPGQNGALTFTGTAGQRVSLNITDSTITVTNLAILDPDGSTLGTKRAAPNGFMDVETLPVTGTYRITLNPESTYTGSLKLTLYDVPADASGTITAGGSSVTLTTTTPGQNGALTFAGVSNQRISLNITNSTIPVTNVSILKPDGKSLASSRADPNGFLDVQTLPVTGTYRITLNPESTYAGSLTLTLYDVPADASGTITAGGPAVTVTTTTPGQNGALTFAGTTGQRITLNITNSTIPVTNISILKPDGKSLATKRADPNGFLDVQTLPATGTYRITLNPESTKTGSLTLTLYDVPADASGTITAGGPSVTVTIATPGQNGAFTFTGTAGQRITLNITNSTIPVTNVAVLKPDGSTLATKRASPNGVIDALTLPVTGTYRITLNPESTYTGSLTLTLQ